ncbi:MAG TPA: hypothetical protein VHA75_20135 [Rugosimonospora sp.]|nr:hypothetical protein [Rugosimonospora sp.]
MAVVDAAVVVLVVVTLPFVPCLLILVVRVDELWDAAGRARRRRRKANREKRDARRLLRAAGVCRGRFWHRRVPTVTVVEIAPMGPVGPPIERLAADLRRLAGQRTGLATRSPVWFSAVQRAYDDRLALACRELEIAQHLGELAGLDLDIERVRVEGMLQQAGLAWRDAEADRT